MKDEWQGGNILSQHDLTQIFRSAYFSLEFLQPGEITFSQIHYSTIKLSRKMMTKIRPKFNFQKEQTKTKFKSLVKNNIALNVLFV